MLDDLAKSVKAQLYERVSSPLLASFALAWAAWNYRFILVLVSSMSATEKIAYIDSHIFPTLEQISLHGALYPLLTALALIFLYPIPAKYVYQYWRQRQKELKEIQQQIDDETPLTKEEARQLRREALSASLEYDKALQSRATEITRLKELVEELQNRGTAITAETREQKTSAPTGASDDLDDGQIEMLEKIAQSPVPLLKKSIVSAEKDRVLAEYNLGELLNREYVSQSRDSDARDYRISPTHKGRTAIVQRARNRSESA